MNKTDFLINIPLIEGSKGQRDRIFTMDDLALKCTKNLDELQTFLKPTHPTHPYATVLQR